MKNLTNNFQVRVIIRSIVVVLRRLSKLFVNSNVGLKRLAVQMVSTKLTKRRETHCMADIVRESMTQRRRRRGQRRFE